jgi:UDP-N-acetylmuramoyl-tripeptide--D-alanyl-D-alanine ligase
MKSFIRAKIVDVLSYLSRETLSKTKPVIIAVTGNMGKTTTKDYIYNLLEYKFGTLVRASDKSQNSEIGVNLTILGEKNAWNNLLAWSKIIFRNYYKISLNNSSLKNYPKILVLEVGADKPGDIKYITSIVKPDLVVLTAFQESPSHGEFFLNIDQHINEKKVLVEKLNENGVIVYNSDDKVMSEMAHEKKSKNDKVKIFSFGTSENSNVFIKENLNLYNEDAEIIGTKVKIGINFGALSEELELRLLGIVGQAHLYSLAAAICVALLNEFNKVDLLEAIKNLNQNRSLSKSRMSLLNGINNSKIIDDTYNSSPKASVNAIETASKILSKGKKVAILGHMAELGSKTKIEHFNIGLMASKVFDVIILSGKYNEYYLEGLREGKFNLENLYMAQNPDEVLKLLSENNLIKDSELVLVKGSQSARLEKVVVELLVDSHDRAYVCRQDDEWQKR